MFQIRNLTLSFVCLFTPGLAAQSLPYELHPGDLVIADTSGGGSGGPAIRVLRANGQVDNLLVGSDLDFPADVYVDRDGAILVSNWEDQWSSNNQILRLDPLGGPIVALNNTALADNFTMVRDTQGDLIVADGFAGLARIDDQGDIEWYSSGGNYQVAIGVDLDYDGGILLAEAWNYLMGPAEPGFVFHIGPLGHRTVVAQDPQTLYSPNDLALAPDGSVIVSNYSQGAPASDLPRLVRVSRTGNTQVLAEAGLLLKPKGVVVGDFGEIFLADTDDQSVLQWDGVGGMIRVLWDLSDGLNDGTPVDRPFGLALVPSLWLRTESFALAGTNSTITLESVSAYWGQPVALAASAYQSATPMASIWPSSPRTSHVDLARATIFRRLMPANGTPLVLTGPIPVALAGQALHLQGILGLDHLTSNYVALPVK